MLPKIRSNQVDESELTLLISDYNNSPFEREKFLTVLNCLYSEKISKAFFLAVNSSKKPTIFFLISVLHTLESDWIRKAKAKDT